MLISVSTAHEPSLNLVDLCSHQETPCLNLSYNSLKMWMYDQMVASPQENVFLWRLRWSWTHIKRKRNKKPPNLDGYESPDSCCKMKSLTTNAAFLPKSFWITKMKGNVTQNHSTAYTRRNTRHLHSPEAFDCSGPCPMQLLPSPQTLVNMSSVWSPTQLKIFLISHQNFPWGQLAAVASYLSPGYLQEKTSSQSHSAVAEGGKALSSLLFWRPNKPSSQPLPRDWGSLWAPWCSSLQYVSARFYKSSDNRDSSQERT